LRSRKAAALCALLLLAACVGGLEPGAVAPAAIPDPTQVTRADGPHDALVCPRGACAKPDRTAPVYPVAPEALFAAVQATVAGEPRTTVVATDPQRLLLLAQQRTPVFRFVDTVAIRVLPAPGGASFAAYSHSEVGWYDFGANRARLARWQADLESRLGVRPAAG
jgi:uncharacterized protein (DUF1499 family)